MAVKKQAGLAAAEAALKKARADLTKAKAKVEAIRKKARLEREIRTKTDQLRRAKKIAVKVSRRR